MTPEQEAMKAAIGVSLHGGQAGYESTLVGRAIRYLRPDINISELKRANRNQPLDFSMLRTAVPEFPLHLMGIHVPYVHETTLQDMFTRPYRSVIFREFEKQQSANGWDIQKRNYGIVTGWAQMEAMVFHTWPRAGLRDEVRKGYIRMEFFSCAGHKPMTYYLESFNDLLEDIKRMMDQ